MSCCLLCVLNFFHHAPLGNQFVLKELACLNKVLPTLPTYLPETLKQGTKIKYLGPIFWGLEFLVDLGSLGPRSGALFGPRAETGNKKSEKK